MRVILINPWTQTISEAEFSGQYADYYRLLSGPTLDGHDDDKVTCFDMTSLDGDLEDHLLVVDDVGFCQDVQAYFQLCGRTFAGRGVIVQSDGESEHERGATVSIEQVTQAVTFLPIGTEVEIAPTVVHSFENADALWDFLSNLRPSREGPNRPSADQ
jgi:hypothetical protein